MDDGNAKPETSRLEHNIKGPTYKYVGIWNEDTNCVNHFMVHKQANVSIPLDFVAHNFYKYSYMTEQQWLRFYKGCWDMME